MIIDGRQIAAEILDNLKTRVDKLKENGITPHLYIFLITDDPSTLSYVKQKLLKAEKIGAKITVENVNPQITTEELLSKINKLNEDACAHGIIIQRPAPKHLDLEKLDNAIIPEKEIDGFANNSKYIAPVTAAVFKMLKKSNTDLNSSKIIVIGKGETAGRPIINQLIKLGIKPLIIDSKTDNPGDIIKTADIVISAVGKREIIKAPELKNGAILIGVGMHKEEDGKFHGDFNEAEISQATSFYSPTPGGVGPINVACLLENLVEAAETLSK